MFGLGKTGGLGWVVGGGKTIDGEPFIEVLSFWEEDRLFEVSGSEDGGCVAFKLGGFGAFLDSFFWLERVAGTGVSTVNRQH